MTTRLLNAATVNNWRVKLTDNITDSQTAFALVSNASLNPSQLQPPGVLVLDRIDSNDVDTPGKREYLSFGSLSGITLAGVVRGLAGSTAQSHSANSWAEDVPSVTHWGDLVDYLGVEHLADGTHNPIRHIVQLTVTGVSGASGIRGDLILVPGGNISIVAISGVSGYSAIKISGPTVSAVGGISQLSVFGPLFSGTMVTPPLLIEDVAVLKSVSAVLFSPVSGASLILDINKNFTSIFTDQNTRPTILGGGTYVSTASIGTTALNPGNLITMDIDNPGGTTLSVLLET